MCCWLEQQHTHSQNKTWPSWIFILPLHHHSHSETLHFEYDGSWAYRWMNSTVKKAKAGFYLRAVLTSLCKSASMAHGNLVEHESQLTEETQEICSEDRRGKYISKIVPPIWNGADFYYMTQTDSGWRRESTHSLTLCWCKPTCSSQANGAIHLGPTCQINSYANVS